MVTSSPAYGLDVAALTRPEGTTTVPAGKQFGCDPNASSSSCSVPCIAQQIGHVDLSSELNHAHPLTAEVVCHCCL